MDVTSYEFDQKQFQKPENQPAGNWLEKDSTKSLSKDLAGAWLEHSLLEILRAAPGEASSGSRRRSHSFFTFFFRFSGQNGKNQLVPAVAAANLQSI